MRIFTSYYGNSRRLREAGAAMICVSVKKPAYFSHIPQISAVCPTYYMISRRCPHDEYLRLYDQILARLDPRFVLRQIEEFAQGRDAALCCYEKPGDFCHRHILARWLTEGTGVEVTEFPAPAPAERRVAAESRAEQISLF